MMNVKVNLTGCVCDSERDFKCGFDISVENGGSVAEIGSAVQTLIDTTHAKSVKKED